MTLSAVASRPTLHHTSSASSLTSTSTADKAEAYKTPNLTSRYQTARSTDRTKLLSRSTLKGFGGPVKRSKAVLQSEEEDTEQQDSPGLLELNEERELKRSDGAVPALRSTTPYGDPPAHDLMSLARISPPRSTTPLDRIPTLPPAESSSSARHRMSPPRRMLNSIPDTILEAAEAPPSRGLYLDARQQDARSVHTRSTSVSPDVNGASRAANSLARHRHSPSVPVGTSYGDPEKENRFPASQMMEKATNGHSVALQTSAVQQYASREALGHQSRTPEYDPRTFAREISVQNVDPSRTSTLRAEPVDVSAASSSTVTPRAMHNYAPPHPEPQEMQLNHPDPYGAPHSVVPMYMTPAQTGPLRQATDYNALQANRTAPAVPPQNYYTDMATATPASTLPPGRKGLIVSVQVFHVSNVLAKVFLKSSLMAKNMSELACLEKADHQRCTLFLSREIERSLP